MVAMNLAVEVGLLAIVIQNVETHTDSPQQVRHWQPFSCLFHSGLNAKSSPQTQRVSDIESILS